MYGWDSHDDVVENFDFEKLARSNEVASDLDVRFGRRGGRRSDGYCASPIYVHQEGRKFGAVRICSASASQSRLAFEHHFPYSYERIWLRPGPQILGSPKRTADRNRNQRILSCAAWTGDGRRASRAVFPQSTST